MRAATTTTRRCGLAAFLWAVAFGIVSAYWALGGTIGVDQLSPALRDQAARRESTLVAVLWGTAVLKILGGLVPLALAFLAVDGFRRRLLATLTWLGGVLLTLYGLGDVLGATLVLAGASGERNSSTVWYLLLWGPVWLLGGALFLATAWSHRRDTISSQT